MKVLCTAFFLLHFDFVIFWQKNIGAKKADCKMLMKLTKGDTLFVKSDTTCGEIFAGFESSDLCDIRFNKVIMF